MPNNTNLRQIYKFNTGLDNIDLASSVFSTSYNTRGINTNTTKKNG